MWDKIHLLMADTDSAPTECYASDIGVVKFTSTASGAKLKSLKIYGTMDETLSSADGGIGYTADDGSTHLTVRVHGRNFMDGHELVRLMKGCGSAAYGGEYDENHFLYIPDAAECQVISANDLFIPPKMYTFRMSVLLDEDIAGGGKLSPGLHFNFHARSPMAVSSSTSGVGEVALSLGTPFGYLFKGCTHKPLGISSALPVRYDSVSLSEGTAACTDPYVGQSIDFNIGTPLYCDYFGEVCDELDCASGTLVRNIMAWDIDDSVTLSEVNYEGYACLSMPLPVKAGATDAMMDEFDYAMSVEDFEFGDWLIFVGPDMEHLYIYFMGGMSPEDAKGLVVGKRLLYVRATPEIINLGDSLNTKLGEGEFYAEVCSILRPTVEVTYLT